MWWFQSFSNILCIRKTWDKFPFRELCRAKLISVGQVGDFWWPFSKWSSLAPNPGKSRIEIFFNWPPDSTSVIRVKRWLNFSSNFVGSLCRGVCGHLFPLIRNRNSHLIWNNVIFKNTLLEIIIYLTQIHFYAFRVNEKLHNAHREFGCFLTIIQKSAFVCW